MIRRFGGLRAAIAGLGFAAVGKSALAMADELQDLSNASGIAVGRLLELKKALTTSGGDADMMATALNNFLRTIDDAAEGSIKAQNSFMGLGVSMKDLRKLSEQDLFIKTLEGIAAIENPSRRAAEMMDKFGKSFKTVDPQELLDKLKATAGEGDKYAATIKRAAELNDQLATAQGNLKLAFLEAFSPIIAKIIEFNTATEEGGKKMEGLITVIKLVGIALATSFAVSGVLALVGLFGQVARALTVVLGISSGLGGIFAGGSSLMVGIRGISVLLAAVGTSLYVATQLFEDFGYKGVIHVMKVVESLGILAAAIGGGAFGAGLGTALGGPVGGVIGGIAGATAAGAAMDLLIEKAKKAREAAEYALDVGSGRGKGQGAPSATDLGFPATTPGAGTTGPDKRAVDETARKNAIQSVRDVTLEYEKQQRLRIAGLDFQTRMVGKTEEEKQMSEARRDIFLEYTNTFEQLEKRRNSLTKDEMYLGGEIIKQQKELYKIYLDKDQQLEKAIIAEQTAQAIEKDRLNTLQNITKAIEDQVAKQEALAELLRAANEQKFAAKDAIPASQLVGLSSIQKQIVEIQENARKAAQEAAKAFAEKFGEINTAADAKEFADGLDKIAQAWKGVAGAQTEVAKANYESTRTFSTGWTDAFAKYAEDAQNSAEHAKTYFDAFTKGFEDAIVSLVTGGKFSFKDFANSIIADFARIEARKALTSFMGANGSGGGSVLGSLFTFGKSLFGFANGGTMQAGMPAIVGERGPELFMPNSAGRITSNASAFGRQEPTIINNAVTYSIQAVDASSFRSLVARDPSFMYAVTEQGRRSQPTRRSA
jgi:lambda family phage tail tape measure protein